MSRTRVWVEFVDDKPARIFRNTNAAVTSPAWDESRVKEFPRRDAVAAIRRQVFEASDGSCPLCGQTVAWDSGEMHERIHRGRGGEISIWNSIFVCRSCHRAEHADRNPQWGVAKPK